ncbi:hypothetical protein FGO68_gene9271 [Halteria grandinella]|uniref:Cadherin domain-containing protein n=1 Tax=Halteria grandinella TaxID=5974 RepID=A0A8J8P563_HALGN|nr:hypothetical protein FGO68_gene9271 [Halteria grandinella]
MSCYDIDTTTFQIYTLQAANDYVQVDVVTFTLSMTLTRDSVLFQDMQTQYLTNISSWCPNKDKAFTFDASLPNSFYINYGTQTISLDNLQYCGSPIPSSLSYSFFNTTTQSGISLVPNQPILQITEALKGGTYKGRVAATGTTLSGTQQAIVNYTIVVNMPPYFTSSLSSVIVERGFSYKVPYSLPTIKDDEGHAYTIQIELVSVTNENPSLTCLTLEEALADTTVFVYNTNYKQFTIDVRDTSLPDTWLCDFNYEITLADSNGAASPVYKLTISIVLGNMPPYWVYDPPQNVVMHLGETRIINLPNYADPNGNTISHIGISRPLFVDESTPFKYTLNPTLKKHLGPSYISGMLQDDQTPPLSLLFTFKVTVINFAPYFASQLENQTQIVEEFTEYQLPQVMDYESTGTSDPIYVSVCVVQNNSQCNSTLPAFITYIEEERVFQFKGLKSNQGNYTIQIKLTDKVDSYSVSKFTLRITELPVSQEIQGLANQLLNTGAPEFVSSLPTTINIEEGKSEVVKFPEIKDPDNDQFECTVDLGSAAPFVIFKDLALVISPHSQHVSETAYTVQIILTDKNQYAPKINKNRLDIIVAAKLESKTDEKNSSSEYFISEEEQANGNKTKHFNLTQKEKYLIRLRLTEVTNLGRARIKVYSKTSTKLMPMFSNTTFQIYLVGDDQNENVPYSIESNNSNILVLKLHFNNPQRISISQSYDELVVTTKKQFQIATTSYYEVLQAGITLQSFIPTQLSEEEASKLIVIQKSGDYANYALVSSNLVLNLFLSGMLSYLFSLLNDISQVTMLSLININIPGIASLITSIIMNLVYMDLLQTNLWISNIIDLESSNDDSLCPSFKLAGYTSQFTITNLGSTFVFIFLLICYQAMLFVIKIVNSLQSITRQVFRISQFKQAKAIL